MKNHGNFRTRKDGDEMRGMIMDYLVNYWLENLSPPRIREIADAMKISTSHVSHHLDYLEHQGKIIRQKNKDEYRHADIIPIGLKVSYEPDTD